MEGYGKGYTEYGIQVQDTSTSRPWSVVVVPETVGQYTGLTDKNGEKIFEGDILDCGDRIVRVSWHEMCGTWDCDFVRYKGTLCSNGIEPVEWKYRAEKIGNIHDNPELLEGNR
jgi:uncharacterized phage protein (TIGR01671 family)